VLYGEKGDLSRHLHLHPFVADFGQNCNEAHFGRLGTFQRDFVVEHINPGGKVLLQSPQVAIQETPKGFFHQVD